MKAICWDGPGDLVTDEVPDPKVEDPTDVVLRVRMSATCGSDLHFLHGILPSMERGDVFGHEFMGEIVATGSEVSTLKVGDRVVVPSIIGCGHCDQCRAGKWMFCDRSNPNQELQIPVLGYPTAAFYGCSHMYGGIPGSHAEYIRVPHGEVNCFKIPDGITDEQAVFLSDGAPTALLGVELAEIRPGEDVVVWGCGGVGLLTISFALAAGAGRVFAVDKVPERLAIARMLGAITIDFSNEDVVDVLKDQTGGVGPDHCIDAVGLEAAVEGLSGVYDKVKQKLHLETDRGTALRQAIKACRRGGTLTILGIYFVMDKFPLGVIINKGLTVHASLQNGHQHIPRLLELTAEGKLDTSYLATHRFSLDEASTAYNVFREKEDGCIRAVFVP